MTFSIAIPPALISIIKSDKCNGMKTKSNINYDVGTNSYNELFVRITSYDGEGNISNFVNKWFLIFDLTQLFSLANGESVVDLKFEPFDDNGNLLSAIHNTNMSAFLKSVLLDTIK